MFTMSDIELSKILTEIDAELRAEYVNIPARPLVALSKLSVRLNFEIRFPGEFADRIVGWFDRLYGDRLKMGCALGTTVVLIAGDIYRVALPLFFGTSLYALDIGPASRMTKLGGREVNLTNIAQFIEGLTPARLMTITEDDRNGIVNLFASAMVSSSDFVSVTYPNFIPETRGDLTNSVDHLLTRPAQLGLSRWASLQVVETVLKACIEEQGGQIKQIHILNKLADAAEQLGLTSVDRKKLNAVQCSASVRYGEESSTLLQAYEAHASGVFFATRPYLFAGGARAIARKLL
jgi:hypothetical protein